MSWYQTAYWVREEDDGTPISVYRRRLIDGQLVMDRYSYAGQWSNAYDYLLRVIEEPNFRSITAEEANRLLPKIARSRANVR